MRDGNSYIRDSSHFLEKIKSIRSIPDNAMLVTADVVGLYPSIPHSSGLNSLRKALEKRLNKQIPTNDLVKMAKFVLSNNYFEFSEKVFQQISGTAIGTKFAPPYACIYMEEVETEFLKTQRLKPLIWLRFIDDIFFIWTYGEENLKNFMEDFNNFKPNLKFTFQSSVTTETFKINHRLTCDDKCLVYLFTCKTCSKQYTGETTDQFRLRWNNYKSNDRKFKRGEPCMQEHLFEHFYSDGHNGFLEDVAITLIDKTDGRDPKNRENYWMRTLKTLAPQGLNIEDCV